MVWKTIYKSVKISTGTVIKNPEMLKVVSDHLKLIYKYIHDIYIYIYIYCVCVCVCLCDKATLGMLGHQNLFLTATKTNNCVIKVLTIIFML